MSAGLALGAFMLACVAVYHLLGIVFLSIFASPTTYQRRQRMRPTPPVELPGDHAPREELPSPYRVTVGPTVPRGWWLGLLLLLLACCAGVTA